jgi:copper homeostasis protein CutC
VSVLVEAAVETVASAIQAEREGAGRLELCSDLPRGGTTPGPGMLRAVRVRVDVPLHVMIRPRPGGFQFSTAECEAMIWDIAEAKRTGADGVVIGVLDRQGLVDREWTARLVKAARPLAVTFHRAVDVTPEIGVAVETLAQLGIDRVLTSGGAATALQGLKALAALVREFGARIGIMPCGQIRADNAARIVKASRAAEVHVGVPTEAEPERLRSVVAALG